MRYYVKAIAALIAAFLAGATPAAVVTPSESIKVDFVLPLDAPFTLPAFILDYTVSFARVNPLNPGESFQVDSFAPDGTLLSSDSYTNGSLSSIIGCACVGGLLDVSLSTPNFYAILSSLNGTFDVTEVIVLAYGTRSGSENKSRDVGVIGSVPTPSTLTLLPLGALAVLLVASSRFRCRITSSAAKNSKRVT